MYKDHKSTRHLKEKMISFFELLRYFHIKSLKAQNHDFHQSGSMYWLIDYFGYFWCTFHRWKLKILWSIYWHMYVYTYFWICFWKCMYSYTSLKNLLYKNIFCIRFVGLFCLMAIWILLLLDCSKRRYYRSTSTFISHRLWYWWFYFPTCDRCCL